MKNKKAAYKKQAKQAVVCWTDIAWEDYLHWQKHDVDIVAKINLLVDECVKTPFTGSGKPEPLRGDLTGYWSRRINREHRLVYLPQEGGIYVVGCRYHY